MNAAEGRMGVVKEGGMLGMEYLETPVGPLLLVTDEDGRLHAVEWVDYQERMFRLLAAQQGAERATIRMRPGRSAAADALAAYFSGELDALDTLSVHMSGTPFQRTVWAELRRITVGTTITYGELARRIGRPAAIRAVGSANRVNSVNVVIPCHRVVGANASLTGYGSGLPRKQWLLDHEAGRLTLFA
ncbi:methylated-DNA--[protein]-cysteine S-methyltransferase [Aureimonas psammosilenae]|uniref:methylated-DNA--[protein]-cysteine S-methyltransferase n=1 Tax=Aureimonas psammosilenae TaxID=2495496 RepID=UPI001F2DBA98|nr:methylated-DNA--[protein]-cysteine S-methyltransferase [Aureimonas psammosilenae]